MQCRASSQPFHTECPYALKLSSLPCVTGHDRAGTIKNMTIKNCIQFLLTTKKRMTKFKFCLALGAGRVSSLKNVLCQELQSFPTLHTSISNVYFCLLINCMLGLSKVEVVMVKVPRSEIDLFCNFNITSLHVDLLENLVKSNQTTCTQPVDYM